MKHISVFIFIITFGITCYSQSTEATLYLRKELVKQRSQLLEQASRIQSRIDSIDQSIGYGSNQSMGTEYFSKPVNTPSSTTRSKEFSESTNTRKTYSNKISRTYYRGSRGGCYYINSNGNKTYVARSMCN